jgi:hypothetical protein
VQDGSTGWKQRLGPLIDGLIISLGGKFPWAAAIGFAFVAGVVLLIWRRTRTREELAPQKLAAHGIGARGIAAVLIASLISFIIPPR